MKSYIYWEEGEQGREHEASGRSSWVKDIEEEKEKKDTFKEGAIVVLARKQALGKFPGIPKDDPR